MSFYHLNPNRRGERMAQRLERMPDYRVLRRLPHPDEIWCSSMPIPTNVFKLAVLDVETTGLDPERHKIIELAIGSISVDLDGGDVVDVQPPKSWLEDPAEDLSIEIERLTHITSDMLIGRWFPGSEVAEALAGCDGIAAHNAKFDYGFVTRRFPETKELPWLCSMSELDWPELGFAGGRSIGALLTQAGFFLPDAHRAGADVWATTCLLASNAGDSRSISALLIERASRETYRVYAHRAPFACKDVLKNAGYRWSPERRAWWLQGDAERIDNEEAWLKSVSTECRPRRETLNWKTRYK